MVYYLNYDTGTFWFSGILYIIMPMHRFTFSGSGIWKCVSIGQCLVALFFWTSHG